LRTLLQPQRNTFRIQNALKEPFNPKFRTFRLNNKVSDRMAKVYGGIDLLRAMHFSVFCSSSEYVKRELNNLRKKDHFNFLGKLNF